MLSMCGRSRIRNTIRGRVRIYLFLLMAAAAFLSARYLVPVNAQFSDTETVSCNITAGTWETETGLKICRVCPSWGIAGACRWPVFIHGEGFRAGAVASLARGEQTLPAVKTWVLRSNVAYAVIDLRGASAGVYDVRLRLPDGREAVLYGGFTVGSWLGCGPDYVAGGAGGGGGTCWQKHSGVGGPGTLGIAPAVAPAVGTARAYAVAPGVLIEGSVVRGGKGGFTVVFDLRGAPGKTFDVVLFTPQDYPLVLEGFITPADLQAAAPALSVSEGQAPVEERAGPAATEEQAAPQEEKQE